MQVGSDLPGRITRLPGGVAMNIAMTLRRFGMRPQLLTAMGRDAEGTELMAACRRMGLGTDHVYLSEDLPTDRYMAIEGAGQLVAAIADAHSLEAAGKKILRPLLNGPLGSEDEPYAGIVAIDGNLTEALLEEIALHPAFIDADLRIAPASPGKAERLTPFLVHGRGTLYVNLEEAGLLCHTRFDDSATAAAGLLRRGASRVLVTDGGRAASFAQASAGPEATLTLTPPEVLVSRVTGAGDTFMAAHIAAEASGSTPRTALSDALRAAADYVSGEIPG